MKHITSRDNPTFKELKSLAGDAREQRRQARTVLDGIHLVAAYCEKVGLPEQLILSQHGAGLAEIQALRALFSDAQILLLGDGLFRELSELASPTGICAVIRVPEAVRPGAPGAGGSCVLLDGLQDPGNVGSILRTAAAAGIVDVFLGAGCAGVWTPRVLRAAQGAHFELHLHTQVDLASTIASFGGLTIAATAHGGGSLFDQNLGGDIAWLFGSEGGGVSPALMAGSGKRVHIPMAVGSESLNVAAAAAICLFEQVRQRRQPSYAV